MGLGWVVRLNKKITREGGFAGDFRCDRRGFGGSRGGAVESQGIRAAVSEVFEHGLRGRGRGNSRIARGFYRPARHSLIICSKPPAKDLFDFLTFATYGAKNPK